MNILSALRKFYFQLILLVFGLLLIFVLPSAERVGDRLQYIVPLIGLTCAFELDEAGEYFGRYAAGLASVHIVKNVAPDQDFAKRPDGGDHGFPSGHTYSATYGASYIVRQCAKRVPYLGTAAAVGAAFTGASRVDAQKHSAWQVFWGMIFGLAFDLGFRTKKSRARVRRAYEYSKPKAREFYDQTREKFRSKDK